MKPVYILFFLLIFSVATTKSQTAKDKQAILQLLDKQKNAWNIGDIEGYMSGYWNNDSLLFVGKTGPTYGWQNTLDNYKRSYPDKSAMGILTFGIKKVEFLDTQKAFILGSWHLKRAKDEPQGYFTLIIQKIKGVWQIIIDHSS